MKSIDDCSFQITKHKSTNSSVVSNEETILIAFAANSNRIFSLKYENKCQSNKTKLSMSQFHWCMMNVVLYPFLLKNIDEPVSSNTSNEQKVQDDQTELAWIRNGSFGYTNKPTDKSTICPFRLTTPFLHWGTSINNFHFYFEISLIVCCLLTLNQQAEASDSFVFHKI